MAFGNYTELKASVADWLNRTDLTAQVADFIGLAEAEMKRRVRRSTTRATVTISAYATTLPSGAAELRSIRLVTASPTQDLPFRLGTKEMVDERMARASAVAGRPDTACVFGGELLVAPTPDQSYSAEIVYFTQLTALSATATTSALLTEAPDAYLFGALLQAAPYLEHDERIPVWQAKFDEAIDQLNMVRENEEHHASIRGVRLPVVF